MAPPPSPSPPGLTVSVALRRGLLLSLVTAVVALLVALTLVLQRGYSLGTFNKATQPAKDIEKTVDTYNSYSGTVSSAVQRPIEVFLASIIQVVVLSLLAPQLLRRKPSVFLAVAAMALGALLGFLLNNSLAALNVQQRERPIEPAIRASDLSRNSTDLLAGRASTSVLQTLPEDAPRNSITNTVLRSLLLPREFELPSECSARGLPGFEYAPDGVDYGIVQRDWMKDMLRDALDAKTFTVVINATSKNVSQQPVDELPMPATLAADLFLTSMQWLWAYLPWRIEVEREGSQRPDSPTTPVPAAVFAGLLPPNDTVASEHDKRTFFVNQTSQFFRRNTVQRLIMSPNDMVLKFSHVAIADNVAFDALTVELDMDPAMFQQTTMGNGTKSTRQTTAECRDSPYPDLCVFATLNRSDVPTLLHAYTWCSTKNGSDRLWTTTDNSDSEFSIGCDAASASSLLMVGVGKRLSADAMANYDRKATATNLRKTYSVTFGRLSWNYSSLATAYNANCEVTTPGGCSAVEYKLPGDTKRLLVGADAVPLKRLRPLNFTTKSAYEPLPLQVVRIYDPPADADTSGDILLPHNVRNLTFAKGDGCTFMARPVRLRLVLNNHLYMEHPLQATYTAAMFLLFQDAVTRDVLPLSKTLAFDGNVQYVDVWLSVPTKSAWITLAGCAALMALLLLGLLWQKTASLGQISEPHMVARVLVDGATFPPFALHRRVSDAAGSQAKPDGSNPIGHYEIGTITLRERGKSQDPNARVAATA